MSWETIAIEELCLNVTSGGTPLRSRIEFYENGTIPWIKTKEVNFNRIYEADEKITEKGLDNSSAKLIPQNSILIAMYGDGHTAGRCAINRLPVTTNQACCNLVINPEKANPDYMFYKISTLYEIFRGLKSGGSQQNLNAKTLRGFKLQIPPLPTQRKIASILSAYDDLIENNLKRITLLEEKAFVTYKLLDKIEKHKLSDLYDTSSGGTPSRTNAEYFTGEINWFKSKELADSILLESEEKITEGAVDKSSAKLFPTGSVIMAMYGATIGKLGLLSMPSTTNQACCAIIEKVEIKSNYYILNWLLENREYVLSFRMGAAQENISQQVIKNLLVSIPKDADLKIFNSEMKPLYQLIKNIHHQNTKLREARDILLPRLMNGQIEV